MKLVHLTVRFGDLMVKLGDLMIKLGDLTIKFGDLTHKFCKLMVKLGGQIGWSNWPILIVRLGDFPVNCHNFKVELADFAVAVKLGDLGNLTVKLTNLTIHLGDTTVKMLMQLDQSASMVGNFGTDANGCKSDGMRVTIHPVVFWYI